MCVRENVSVCFFQGFSNAFHSDTHSLSLRSLSLAAHLDKSQVQSLSPFSPASHRYETGRVDALSPSSLGIQVIHPVHLFIYIYISDESPRDDNSGNSHVCVCVCVYVCVCVRACVTMHLTRLCSDNLVMLTAGSPSTQLGAEHRHHRWRFSK